MKNNIRNINNITNVNEYNYIIMHIVSVSIQLFLRRVCIRGIEFKSKYSFSN